MTGRSQPHAGPRRFDCRPAGHSGADAVEWPLIRHGEPPQAADLASELRKVRAGKADPGVAASGDHSVRAGAWRAVCGPPLAAGSRVVNMLEAIESGA